MELEGAGTWLTAGYRDGERDGLGRGAQRGGAVHGPHAGLCSARWTPETDSGFVVERWSVSDGASSPPFDGCVPEIRRVVAVERLHALRVGRVSQVRGVIQFLRGWG